MNLAGRIVFILIVSSSLFAQEYIVKKYSMRNGMPSNKVMDLEQDVDGKIWFASLGGLFSYDGQEWVLKEFDENTTEFNRLKKDETGTLWALPRRLSNPIVFYENSRWNSIGTPFGKKCRNVSTCFGVISREGKKRVLLPYSNFNLKYFDGESWQEVKIPDEYQVEIVYSITESDNYFILATNAGVFKFNGNNVSPVKAINKSLPENLIYFADIVDYDNSLYIISQNHLLRFKNDNLEIISDHVPFKDFLIMGRNNLWIKSDDYGRVFFGDEIGIYFLEKNSKKIKQFDKERKIKRRGSVNFLIDREDNIWISDMRGVVKIRKSPFENFNSDNVLLSDEVSAIELLKNGEVIFGQYGSLTRFSNNHYYTYQFDEISDGEVSIARVMDILEDSAGTVWFTAYQRGLGIFENNKVVWKIESKENSLNCLAEYQGKLLIGTSDGVYELDNKGLGKRIEGVKGYIRSMNVLPDGTLGICSDHLGVYVYKNEKVENYTSDYEKTRSTFAIEYILEYGYLVGTEAGLYTIDQGVLTKYSVDGLSIDTPIYFITEDKLTGNLWFGIDNGLVRWNGKTLKRYTESDGLLGTETNRNTDVWDMEGGLWIGTNLGASRYNREYDESREITPIGKIVSLETGKGKVFNADDYIELDYNDNSVRINYRSYCYTNEDLNKFKVVLQKGEDEIIDSYTTTDKSIRYSSLAPGRYTFLVKIINSNGLESNNSYQLTFKINNPFYSETWFLIVSAITLTILFWLFLDYLNQRRYSNRLKNDVENRTRELSEKVYELEEVQICT